MRTASRRALTITQQLCDARAAAMPHLGNGRGRPYACGAQLVSPAAYGTHGS